MSDFDNRTTDSCVDKTTDFSSAVDALNAEIDAMLVPASVFDDAEPSELSYTFSPAAEAYLRARAVDGQMAWRCGVRGVTEGDLQTMWPEARLYGEGLLVVSRSGRRVEHRRAVLLEPSRNLDADERPRKAHSDGDVPPFFAWTEDAGSNDPLYVVESPVKAMALAGAGLKNAMGLGGVDAGAFRRGQLHPELLRRVRKGREIVLVLDRDRESKPLVALAEARLAFALREAGAVVSVVALPDVGAKVKGPDDFIAARGAEAFLEVVRNHRHPSCPRERVASSSNPTSLAKDLPFLASLAVRDAFVEKDLALAALAKAGIGKRTMLAALKPFELAQQQRAQSIAASQNPNQFVLQRGDETEVADLYAKRLGGGAVFTRGEIWRYDSTRGVYHVEPEANGVTYVASLAGSPVESAGRPPYPLRVSHNFARGAVSLAAKRIHDATFFDDAPRGLTFENGFVTAGNGGAPVVRPHSAENRSTAAYDFPFQPGMDCPMFKAFLREIWIPNADREERILFLQEFIGACLLGVAPRMKKSVFMRGESDCGKSSLANVVSALFPAGTVTSLDMSALTDKFRRAELSGKLLNVVSEVRGGELVEAEAFKEIVAGDAITAERKHRDPFTFRPAAGHLLGSNNPPRITDRSNGTWNRLVVLTFDQLFSTNGGPGSLPMRQGLCEAIIEAERATIVCWAIDGAARLCRNGAYTDVPSANAAKADWQFESNPVERFAVEELLESPTASVKFAAIYDRYRHWCQENGVRHVVSSVTFGGVFRKVIEKKFGRASRVEHGHKPVYRGLALRSPEAVIADYASDLIFPANDVRAAE